jgi:hypothetical protein
MPSESSTLQVRGLAKRQVAEVSRRANRLGMTPESYLKHLVEQDLAISRRAKITSLDELMADQRDADEREIDRLVEAAKTKYHRRNAHKE